MAIPWTQPIKRNRQLAIYWTPSTKNPDWGAVMGRAIKEFSTLSKKHSLGIRLISSSQPPKDEGGADVSVNVATAKISLNFAGTTVSESFNERSMHGRTFQFSRDGAIFKAFIFLPSYPQINTPTKPRLVGPHILTLIALHELLHACGLEDSDHSPTGVFQANPSVDLGDTAAGDKARTQSTAQNSWMPPFMLSEVTARNLKSLWTS